MGGQGSKVVNGGSKSNSKEGNYMERTCLTSKEFGIMLLMMMPRVHTTLQKTRPIAAFIKRSHRP